MVTPAGAGGAVDDDIEGIQAALHDAFATPHVSRRIEKLQRTPADERHLLAIVRVAAALEVQEMRQQLERAE